MSHLPRIDPKWRMILSVLAELFTAMSATIAGGMVVQGQAKVPESWPLLVLLGMVIGFGKAWSEVKMWMNKLEDHDA